MPKNELQHLVPAFRDAVQPRVSATGDADVEGMRYLVQWYSSCRWHARAACTAKRLSVPLPLYGRGAGWALLLLSEGDTQS